MSSASQLLFGNIQGLKIKIPEPLTLEEDLYFNLVPTLLRSEDSGSPSDIPNTGYVPNVYTKIGTPIYSNEKKLNWKGRSLLVGEGSYLKLETPQQSDPASHNYCIEAWVYCDTSSGGTDHILYSFSSSGFSSRTTLVARSADGKAKIYTHTSTIPEISSVSSIPTDTWVHLRFSKEKSTYRIFINGALDAMASGKNSIAVSGFTECFIGAGSTTTSLEISDRLFIDNLRVTVGHARSTDSFSPAAMYSNTLTGLPKYPVYDIYITSLNTSSPRIRELDFVGTSIAAASSAYASSYSAGNPPSYAFDRNTATYAINTTTVPNTLGFDFGNIGEAGPQSLQEFRVMVDQTFYSPKDFSIRRSYNRAFYETLNTYNVTSWPSGSYVDFTV